MSKQIKKIIPFGLILLILVGLFGSGVKQVEAQEGLFTDYKAAAGSESSLTRAQAVLDNPDSTEGEIIAATELIDSINAYNASPGSLSTGDSFKGEVFWQCVPTGIIDAVLSLPRCLVSMVSYYIYFQLFAFLLYLSALFFNSMIVIGISSSLTSSAGFINIGWAVVRDFSNIFFILVLLYVAIQTILGIGHDTKKIIVNVIIMALLINFSMFFTKVVIDSSNILALVFYNKLEVNDNRPRTSITFSKEKDFAGEMYDKFDVTQLLQSETLNKMKTGEVFNPETRQVEQVKEKHLPFMMTIGIIWVAGIIMIVAAYAFFVAGFSFLARLLELWVLIIFAPFAFMSWTLPKLSGFEYLGWDSWYKRLIEVSFTAPIFMFFMYLILLFVRLNPFDGVIVGSGWFSDFLKVVIPGLIIILLLLKATKYAKKAGGKLGDIGSSLAKLAGGLAIGAVTGGSAALAAKGLQASAGRAGIWAAEGGGEKWAANKDRGLGGWSKRQIGKFAKTDFAKNMGDKLGESTFDIRKGVGSAVLGTVSKISGVNMGIGTGLLSTEAGGRRGDLKRRSDRAKEIADKRAKVGEREPEKEALDKANDDKNKLNLESSSTIDEIERKMKEAKEKAEELAKDAKAVEKTPGATQEKKDEANKNVAEARGVIKELKDLKSLIKDANGAKEKELAQKAESDSELLKATKETGKASAKEIAKLETKARASATAANVAHLSKGEAGGKSINELEDEIIPDLKHKVSEKENTRLANIATNLENRWSLFNVRGAENKANARVIRARVELPKKPEKHHELGTLGHTIISAGTEILLNKESGSDDKTRER